MPRMFDASASWLQPCSRRAPGARTLIPGVRGPQSQHGLAPINKLSLPSPPLQTASSLRPA
eukprot:2601360-Alexandrium_andersonii.AAC.1